MLEKSTLVKFQKNFHFWLPVIFFTVINLYFACNSWDEIRESFAWIKALPEKNNFKLRHFVQFSPLALFVALALQNTFQVKKGRLYLWAFFSTTFVGGLSELIQSFAPQRLATWSDWFSNIVAGLFGLLIFYISSLCYKKTNWRWHSKLQNDLGFLLLIIGLAIFTRLYFLEAPILTDSWRLLTASKNTNVHSIDYWLWIFTNPINGPQYRPVSFFAVFYFFRSIFGDSIVPYRLLGMFLLAANGMLIYLLCSKMTKSRWVALFGAMLFIFHDSTYYISIEISHIEKYLFPLFELLLGLYILYLRPFGGLVFVSGLFLLTCFSIMSHEAAFLFPFLFIGFEFSLRKVFRPSYWVILIPSIVYLSVRIFLFGVPQEGFMKVNILNIFSALPRYINSMITPPQFLTYIMPTSIVGILVVFLILVLSIYKAKESKSDQSVLSLFFIIATLLLLLPFSVLENHFFRNRSIWAVAMLVFALSTLFPIKSTVPRRFGLGSFAIIFAFVFYISFSFSGVSRLHKKMKSLSRQQVELKAMLSNQINQASPNYSISSTAENGWVYRSLFPGFLAFHFPKKRFILHDNQREEMEVLVENGTYYTNSGGVWLDPFNVPKKIKVPKAFVPIKIESQLIMALQL